MHVYPRRANRVVGYAAGLLTWTPFDKWQQAHAEHHATVGDLGAGTVMSTFGSAGWPKQPSVAVAAVISAERGGA